MSAQIRRKIDFFNHYAKLVLTNESGSSHAFIRSFHLKNRDHIACSAYCHGKYECCKYDQLLHSTSLAAFQDFQWRSQNTTTVEALCS